MRKLLLLIGVVLLVVVGVLAVACSSGTTETTAPSNGTTGSTAAATGEPIKIGHILDLTGPQAMAAQEMEASLQYAFDKIGGQIAGRPVQIIIGDAAEDSAKAITIARKMVEQDKVVAIFGPTEIGEKFAVANYIKSAGIPLILYNPTPAQLFQDNKWVVGTNGTTAEQPICMADYLYKQLNYRTIITLTQDNDAGHAFLDPLATYFTQLGGNVVQQLWVPMPCSDFSPYLTTLTDADALVAWTAGSDAIAFFSQWHEMGIDQKLPVMAAFHGGFTDPFVPASMSPEDAAAMIGVLTPQLYSPDSTSQINVDFVQGLTPITHYPPAHDGVSGPYQAALIFQAALTATNGDTTPDTLLSAIFSTSIEGPNGPESFASGEQAATMNVYITKVEKVPDVENTYHYVTVYTYKAVPPEGLTGN